MRLGQQTWWYKNQPKIIASAAVVGPDEGKGPLSSEFDKIHPELDMGEKSWEKAEQRLLSDAASIALNKAGLTQDQLQMFVSGDLINQITSSSFVARDLSIPYLGVFGACSTSMEGLAIASQLVSSGALQNAMAATCSHNCTVEKQFRYPTEYGAQKPPTAQYTVTGGAAALLSLNGEGPVIEGATIGRIMDLGMTDPFNMGGAMAPAAVDTIIAHLNDTGRKPKDYDLIVTGDLASVGYPIARELLMQEGVPIQDTHFDDCGLMIYDIEKQAVQAGGSGCGCSGVVTYGPILNRIRAGELNRVLIVATGALLSPLTYQQGESIPCIAHAVSIARGGISS